jgi:hypothetical protein
MKMDLDMNERTEMNNPEELQPNDLEPLFDQRMNSNETKTSSFPSPVVPSPDFIDDVETFEPTYTVKENMNEEFIRRENERVDNPQLVLNRVVFDSVEPSPFQKIKSPTEPYYKVKTQEDTTLVFESRFESGNLRRATQIYQFEYDLILKWDHNTKGNVQWYYFSLTNTRKEQKYVFNIINMLKPNSLYNFGMKPCFYSQIAANTKHVGWVREGEDIYYYQNTFKKGSGPPLYTLTFSITSKYDHDTIYLAHCYPYTYSDLTKYLDSIVYEPMNRNRVRKKTLCQTLAGRNCDVLTITNFNSKHEVIRERKGITLFARVHPGESNSSWMMKGIIDYLMFPTLKAKLLRDHFVFKIVPMINPDGVVFGNNRCGAAGVDLNRCWQEPSKKQHPTIYHSKAMVKQFNEDQGIFMSCDLHGHSRKKNIFMYGCPSKQKNKEKLFPKLMEKASDYFSFNDCLFGVQKAKESTARIVLFKEFGITNSYTIEASFCGASFGNKADFHFNQEELQEFGHEFCEALLVMCSDSQLVKSISDELDVPPPFEEEIQDEIPEEEESRRRKRSKKPIVKKRTQIKPK